MSIYRASQRPDFFRLNLGAGGAKDLVAFYGGMGKGTDTCQNSSARKGLDGTLTNMTPSSAWGWSDYLGRAPLLYNGSANYVSIPAFPTLGDYTIAAWIKTSGNKWQCIVGSSNVRYCYVRSSNDMYTYDGTALAGGTITLNAWNHVMFTRKGTTATHYLNGNQAAENTVSGNAWAALCQIGWVKSTEFFVGQMADVMVWSRAATAETAARLADPSNVMLDLGDGEPLLLPPERVLLPTAVAGYPVLTTHHGMMM